MMSVRRMILACAALTIALTLSGCASSFASRGATSEVQNYDPIPQGIGPMETPPSVETPPEPFVPPAPTSDRVPPNSRT